MVEVINKSVCRGVAGKRASKVKGVVIHNDAGSINATARAYVNSLAAMSNRQLANGFAHYYIDRFTIARVEDTFNMAWHTANADGNANYIGYEVCQSLGASTADFLANEQMVFKQAAEDLKYYGLSANRNTVRLHREFVATSCPHRSWDLHGKTVNSVKDYFIKEIKKYMNGTATDKPAKRETPEGPWKKEYKRVLVNNKDAQLYSNFSWKVRQKGENVGRRQFNATGKYEHENGQTYYSLYNDNGAWEGYINRNYINEVPKKDFNEYKELQGQWKSENKRVMINDKNCQIYSGFNWKKWRKGIDLACKILNVTGKYLHANGFTYYSLYDSKKQWVGYINAGFTSELK